MLLNYSLYTGYSVIFIIILLKGIALHHLPTFFYIDWHVLTMSHRTRLPDYSAICLSLPSVCMCMCFCVSV